MYRLGDKKQADMTATPAKYPQGNFKQKKCRECGSLFAPNAPSHLYCSQECSDNGKQTAYLKRTYGITYADYLRMLEAQNKVCAICKRPGFTMAEHHSLLLVVDHCHSTGDVRGLLCHNCNRALGLMQDSVESLKTAIAYLEGATTIPEGSTPEAIAGGSAQPL
jgi:hypothetical protein